MHQGSEVSSLVGLRFFSNVSFPDLNYDGFTSFRAMKFYCQPLE